MIRTALLPKIYPLTDVAISGLSHAEQLISCAQWGASLVQLREKKLQTYDFYSEAMAALKVAREKNLKLIINDRVDIALAVQADGVHLGQDDLPPQAARQLLGPNALIGYSTHSVEQASHALSLPIDYIAIGPIFGTTTKENPEAQIGLDGLRAVKNVVGNMTLVAIGGIPMNRLEEVWAAGADSIALIGAIWRSPVDATAALRRFVP